MTLYYLTPKGLRLFMEACSQAFGGEGTLVYVELGRRIMERTISPAQKERWERMGDEVEATPAWRAVFP